MAAKRSGDQDGKDIDDLLRDLGRQIDDDEGEDDEDGEDGAVLSYDAARAADKSRAARSAYGTWIVEPKCDHRMTPVVGVERLFGSSVRGGVAVPGTSVTVLLAPEALERTIPPSWATWHSQSFNSHLSGAVVYWPWPDMGVPKDFEDARQKFAELVRLHQQGKIIEVACFGGHGRTGTVLAVIAAMAGEWPATDAASMLRSRYCQRAVESKAQAIFVTNMILALRGGQ
jgi:hypothetical protein